MSHQHNTKRVGKRERTRDSLLVAVQELLLEKPASSISIQDIADRARVVHATFYNYYRTTEEAFEAVNLLLLTAHARTIEATISGMTDPAERVAAACRQTMRIVAKNPELGVMLFDAGLSTAPLKEGIRVAIEEDVRAGMAAGRFEVERVDLFVSIAASMGFGVAMDVHAGRLPARAAEGVASVILHILGLPKAEADAISRSRLPRHDMPALPLSFIELTAQLDD